MGEIPNILVDDPNASVTEIIKGVNQPILIQFGINHQMKIGMQEYHHIALSDLVCVQVLGHFLCD